MKRRHFLMTTIGCVLAATMAHGSARASASSFDEGGGGGEKRKKAGGESYLPLGPVVGSSNKSGGRRGVMSVESGLDIPDGALRLRAEASLPRLRAAYAQAVQIYAAGLGPGLPPNTDYLALTLQRQTDQVLGKPGAKLLLGAVVIN